MAFSKTKPADPISEAEQKVADLVQKIIAAKSAFETAEAAATAAALSGDGLDEAVSVAAQASAKLRAFERAKTQADDKVVELRAAKVAADNAAKREQAVAKLYEWRDEAIEVRAKLVPLVEKLGHLCRCHDLVVQEYSRGALSPFFDSFNGTLRAPDVAQQDFAGLADLISRAELDADSLAARTLSYRTTV